MLRMPLNRYTEGMAVQFNGFNGTVFCLCDDRKTFSQNINSLVMKAVDPNLRGGEQIRESVVRQNPGRMAAFGAAFEIGMSLNMLMEGAA